MNKIKTIVIISLVLLSGVLAFLLYRSMNESCECKCKECEEKKDNKPKLINSGEFERKRIERVTGLKDGYKVLGIATNDASYDKLTSDLSFEVIDYEYDEDRQTNCVSNGNDETNCISAKKVEKDYDRYVYALVAFQKSSKLTADGICGPATRKALIGDTGKSTTKEKNPYTEPTATIKNGSTGESVKWLQWELNEAGYNLNIDGVFGSGTLTALKDFQSKNGLTVDGICGPATRTKLKAV